MSNIRFAGIALALPVAGYIGVQSLTAPSARREVPVFQRIDVSSARYEYESSYASDNDAGRDRLRRSVLDAANELGRDACDPILKTRYIDAATNYVRAWLRIAPCVATSTCTPSDGPRLDRAQEAFGSPLDHRIREAMHKVHQSSSFREGDFPREIVMLLAEMAADPTINPEAAPELDELARDFHNENKCSGG